MKKKKEIKKTGCKVGAGEWGRDVPKGQWEGGEVTYVRGGLCETVM